jgi:hypothetical protein
VETFLIRCYLWARQTPWSQELTDQLLEDLAGFFAERGFRNDADDGELCSLLVAGNKELPESDVFFEELTSDPEVELIVIPATGDD